MYRRIALAVCATLALTVLSALPASAATYGVTLTVSGTKADVAKKLTLTGKVTGSKAGKKTLTVQRRVGSGAWKQVGTVRTTSKGAYSYAYRVDRTGAQALRVVAPAKGSTKTGVSPARAFTGFRWLDLTKQAMFASGSLFIDSRSEVGGNTYDHDIALYASNNGTQVAWGLEGACDASDIDAGIPGSGSETEVLTVQTDDGSAGHTVSTGGLTGANHVTAASDFLLVSRDSSGSAVVLAAPRVHCSVDRLEPISFF